MQEQKERAREARRALGDLGWAGVEFGKEIPATRFVGYDTVVFNGAKIVAMVVEGELAEEIMPGVEGIIVLDQTPFYAEMGGQVADYGTITCGDAAFEVTDVQKNNGGKYMHYGKMVSGILKVGDSVCAAIDINRRKAIMRAHTATHLLQKALRNHLGTHVEQAGSLVQPDELRFDFTHFSAMTHEELSAVEREVNEMIMEGMDIHTDEMPIDEAKKLGAMALFGEKYGDIVRVVKMGDYSVELCGGTHLDNTAKVGPFKIMSENSVAAGVRRIEAKVGSAMLDEFDRRAQIIYAISDVFKTAPAEIINRAKQITEDMKLLRKELENIRAKQALSEIDRYLMSAKDVSGLKVVTAHFGGAEVQTLRQMGDWLRDKEPKIVAVLAASNEDGKITFLAVCGKEAQERGMRAGNLIREVSKVAGGSGGGKPDSAMGGGKDIEKIDDALAIVDDFVLNNIK